MTGEVIKSFLVGLGFEIDDAGLAKFNKSISMAAVKVTALYAAVKIAAAGIVYGISKISEGFEQMGYEYRIISPMINKTLMLRREMLKAYAAAGINITKVVQQSVLLNFSLAKTRFAFEAIYKSVASKFFPLLTKQSDLFRAKIYQNMPKIQNALEKFVKFIFKALEATIQLGTRVWSILSRVFDFFVMLHKATDGWSTVILGLAAAWQFLNLAFLATPLGMIITGLLAILALYDDFKTFQEGGESLFNWAPFIPVVKSFTEYLEKFWEVAKDLAGVIYYLFETLSNLIHLDFTGAMASWGQMGDRLIKTFKDLWEYLKSIVNLQATFGKWAIGGISGLVGASPQAATTPLVNPIGTAANGSNTNQKVNQQTTITIQGSADANSTAKSVAGEQSRVNFDMTRNLKGATR